MPSYLSGGVVFIIGCFVPKRAHASIGQNAHFTICKSVAFIAMEATLSDIYVRKICIFVIHMFLCTYQ